MWPLGYHHSIQQLGPIMPKHEFAWLWKHITAGLQQLFWPLLVDLALLCPAPIGRGIKRWCASDVCLPVAYIGTKSITERPRKTKFGTEVAHVTVTRTSLSRSKGQRSICMGRGGAYCGGLPHSLLKLFTLFFFSFRAPLNKYEPTGRIGYGTKTV